MELAQPLGTTLAPDGGVHVGEESNGLMQISSAWWRIQLTIAFPRIKPGMEKGFYTALFYGCPSVRQGVSCGVTEDALAMLRVAWVGAPNPAFRAMKRGCERLFPTFWFALFWIGYRLVGVNRAGRHAVATNKVVSDVWSTAMLDTPPMPNFWHEIGLQVGVILPLTLNKNTVQWRNYERECGTA